MMEIEPQEHGIELISAQEAAILLKCAESTLIGARSPRSSSPYRSLSVFHREHGLFYSRSEVVDRGTAIFEQRLDSIFDKNYLRPIRFAFEGTAIQVVIDDEKPWWI